MSGMSFLALHRKCFCPESVPWPGWEEVNVSSIAFTHTNHTIDLDTIQFIS